VAPSIVSINVTKSDGTANAIVTGIIVSPSGLVMAEGSSVYGATSLTASVMSSGQSYKATVVGSDPRQDIAVLRLRGASGLQPIHTGIARKLPVGTASVALGAPGDGSASFQKVQGAITAFNRIVLLTGTFNDTLQGIIQTNAPNAYNGGPLATTAGNVIGMNLVASLKGSNGYVSSDARMGYAIPINKALAVAKKIAGQARSS
jgi:S1-C subfamily serine protease